MSDERLDHLLLRTGLLDDGSLSRAQGEAIARQRKLAEIVIDLGLVDERRLAEVTASESGIPLVAPLDLEAARAIAGRFPKHIARRHQVVPVMEEGDTLIVAMIDPFEPGLVQLLESTTGKAIRRAIGIRSEVEMAVIELFGADEEAEITLFAPRAHALELDNQTDEPRLAQTPEDLLAPDSIDAADQAGEGDVGNSTIMAPPQPSHSSDADETTAPTIARETTDSDRIAHLETQMLNVSRSLALIQATLDSIDTKLAHLVESSRLLR